MIHIHENEKSSMRWPKLNYMLRIYMERHWVYDNGHILNAKTHNYTCFIFNNFNRPITNNDQSQLRKDKIIARCPVGLKLNTNLDCDIHGQRNRCWPQLTVPIIHKTAFMSALAFPRIRYQILEITK